MQKIAILFAIVVFNSSTWATAAVAAIQATSKATTSTIHPAGRIYYSDDEYESGDWEQSIEANQGRYQPRDLSQPSSIVYSVDTRPLHQIVEAGGVWPNIRVANSANGIDERPYLEAPAV
jgi:hypothetical protein